jgi:hypothetical protein
VNPGPIETERPKVSCVSVQDQFGDAESGGTFTSHCHSDPGNHWRCAHGGIFASDLASYISGTVVTIDGGLASRGPTAER